MKRMVTISIGVILTAILLFLTVAARKHRWYSNQSNTYGWGIMLPEEQKQYNARMQSLNGYDSCMVFMTEHKQRMDARATEKGVNLPAIAINPCEIMRNRHMYR